MPAPREFMPIFRQYIAPLLIVLVFLFALVVVSARIFLPSDMAAPAPMAEFGVQEQIPLEPQARVPAQRSPLPV